ncbi:Ribonuclease H-like domain,Ribonuclease H domain [Cinara cedri]|uniref:Ribonuclease H-like domain,Ribonuclease H domain n=1 Tax=Cinara cedri TaxID=506608 RepID=A0A5E4MYC0_9HEMI|nr:Ribonuclease H-like domain,Ribonuclease H domain [Cinara cedri]
MSLSNCNVIFVDEHPLRNNIILSDSLSTLLSLNNKIYTTVIAKLIQEKIYQATNRGSNISLIWIPGHCNIEGNEKADEESKKATKSPDTPKLNLITYANVKNQIHAFIQIRCQVHWLRQNTKLRTIKSTIHQWPNPNLNRRERIAINRLRIGHTRLTHKSLMTKEDPPQCPTCGVSITVKHLITECIKYAEDAKKYNISSNIDEALGPNNEDINNMV